MWGINSHPESFSRRARGGSHDHARPNPEAGADFALVITDLQTNQQGASVALRVSICPRYLSRSETVTDRILDSVPRPQDKKVRCKSYTLVRLGRHRQSQRTAQRAAARRAHPRAHRRTGPPAVRRAREPPAACASTHGRVRPTSGLKISSPRAHLSRQRALARDTSRDSCVPTDHSRRYSSQPALATAARAVGVTPGRAAWRAPPLDRARA